jgi:hypothetical protein
MTQGSFVCQRPYCYYTQGSYVCQRPYCYYEDSFHVNVPAMLNATTGEEVIGGMIIPKKGYRVQSNMISCES